ncbi:hypothetical protein PIB30_034265 [Stylosanthes scabra]|uniref:Uncharacterized protein n=1 Tax=Stylosanthes scabra TaxID=79078 RepID=A0ABU6XBI6_9FABA|nr:hypothetical protein [Stylosanthes scabra]
MSLPDKTDCSAVSGDDIQEERFNQNRRCNCFCIPCFRRCGTASPLWERIPSEKEQWWNRCFKKVRECSEIAAGPKWKTFIRRLNYGGGGRGRTHMKNNGGFQYDPMSYALNFDESAAKDDDGAVAVISFSARYASLPNSAKTSMDLGKDAPEFV